MQTYSLSSIFVALFILHKYPAHGGFQKMSPHAVCGEGSWFLYKDEKCLQFIDRMVTQEEAIGHCNEIIGNDDGNQSPLITIKSQEEQTILEKYLFDELAVVDPIWLGAILETTSEEAQFKWLDGTDLIYSNWEDGSPSGDLSKNCSQISSGLYKKGHSKVKEVIRGLWTDTSCNHRSLFLCQKPQVWPDAQIQATLIQLRADLVNIARNPVPIGFLYTQLPSQEEPSLIWPQVVWKDVSIEYAGHFFRVVGGNSSSFGLVQPPSSGGIRGVHTFGRNEAEGHGEYNAATTNEADYPTWTTGKVFTGSHDSRVEMWLDFTVSAEEPRPINQAVRIWKRIN